MVRPRGRLFRKYIVLFAAVVSGVLLASGALEIYFSYQEAKAALAAVQREKALAAAARIEQFVREIERQLGWTTHPLLVGGAAALEQRRIDYYRLWRQVQAITELSHLDAQGREQIRVSRLAMDVIGSGTDYSADPRFREARGGKTYFCPVYFRKESEPYMTVSMSGSAAALGVTVAEVTFTVPNALEVLRRAREALGGNILLGAGTVLDPETARAAILAGAEFIVAPTLIR